jgi:hypothetical protein
LLEAQLALVRAQTALVRTQFPTRPASASNRISINIGGRGGSGTSRGRGWGVVGNIRGRDPFGVERDSDSADISIEGA